MECFPQSAMGVSTREKENSFDKTDTATHHGTHIVPEGGGGVV